MQERGLSWRPAIPEDDERVFRTPGMSHPVGRRSNLDSSTNGGTGTRDFLWVFEFRPSRGTPHVCDASGLLTMRGQVQRRDHSGSGLFLRKRYSSNRQICKKDIRYPVSVMEGCE